MISKESRSSLIQKVTSTSWDLIVIGGGITGAGILREAARRNVKALLLEQKDFSWGTSSRSTKMVHGGLRYLREGNFSLTRKSVLERENLIDELPGLVENKTFILPFYKKSLLTRIPVHIGLIIYDILSGKWRKRAAGKEEIKKRAPSINHEGLQGGFLIEDAVTDDSRLVLRVLAEAIKNGSTAMNYCKADKLLRKNKRVTGIRFIDETSGVHYDVESKVVINATGAWADHLRGQVKKSNRHKIRPLRGSHIVLSADKLPLVDNISVIHPRDGRPVLCLNWEGRVITGTTDIDHNRDLNDEASISGAEVIYLLEAINTQFPSLNIRPSDIISTMAGIRPVIDSGKTDPSKESRDHVIWEEEGLVTVTGGKLTTFRVIALDALKKAQSVIGKLEDLDKKYPLFEKTLNQDLDVQVLDSGAFKKMMGRYGQHAIEMLENAEKEDLESISDTESLWVELKWAAQNEMVVHLDDLLLRRTRIGLLLPEGGKELMPEIRKRCQPVLGWNDEKWALEERTYFETWTRHYGIPAVQN